MNDPKRCPIGPCLGPNVIDDAIEIAEKIDIGSLDAIPRSRHMVGDEQVVADYGKSMSAIVNCLIDIDNAVIVDVEATPARTYDEVAATKTMLNRTEACFDLKPKRLAADTAYGTGKFLGWLVKEKKIAPHIPVWERPKREDGIFSTSDFKWDRRRGVYICHNGKQLRTSGTIHSDGRQRFRACKRDCDACPLRPQCCPKESPRYVARDVHEDARDVARRKMKTKAFLRSRDQRKRVEMRFAHLKTHHGFERLRLRGLSGARDEFHLAAIVQNLKALALRLIRPPPQPACA